MPNTTWNPSDKSANCALSLVNLRATLSGTGGARGVDSLTTGKYYWENTYTTFNTNNITCGISLVSGSFTAPGTGVAWVGRIGGTITVNGTGTGSALGAIPGGSVVGLAVDFGAQQIWFRIAPAGNWNGSGTANPATAAGGNSIASISSGPLYPYMAGSTSDAVTANFGDSAFSGAVPAGFTAGFPVGGGAAAARARVMVLA